ncbi:MAG TPA: uroporphyrinogen decarboxylase family protein [Clostridia bacterium]|nr:uroporphyrinogen decarboxylase family protein [Clostridia bacterium]
MRWTREEYLALATGEDVSRQMVCELFGPLVGLEAEWAAQGATEAEIQMHGFCWDWVPITNVGKTGFLHTFEPKVLEETAEYVLSTDALGRTVKLPKGTATIPLPLDFPVTDEASWLRMKPMLVYEPERVNLEALREAKKAQQAGTLVLASIPGGYDLIRELMGDEQACLAFYDQPELVEDILATAADTAVRVLERVTEQVAIDVLSVHEDMAGRSGPLIGPGLVTQFLKPYYRAAWDVVSSRGTRVFSQDSDGDMSPIIDAFMDCGVTRFYPCEPTGAMDMVALKKKYQNRIIDKHALRRGKAAIDAEIAYRTQPCMLQGGVVFGLDHRIPNGTPLEAYRYYVNVLREAVGREPMERDALGWARMAF